METAKLFTNGNSQAVRLPKEYRFKGNKVGIKKIGNATVLYPIDQEWETFLDGVGEFTDDFLINGRQLQLDQTRDGI